MNRIRRLFRDRGQDACTCGHLRLDHVTPGQPYGRWIYALACLALEVRGEVPAFDGGDLRALDVVGCNCAGFAPRHAVSSTTLDA
jgi:hypothetical protein